MNDSASILTAAQASRERSEPAGLNKASLYREGIFVIIGMILISYIDHNLPKVVSIIIQSIFLLLYYRAKNEYLWIFVVMFISFTPSALFGSGILVFLNAGELGDLTFQMMFILVAWLKSAGKTTKVFYKNQFYIVILYTLILIPFLGAIPRNYAKLIIYYSWLLLLPRLLNREDDFAKLFFLIFIGNVFVFITNIIQILTGLQIVNLISASARLIYDIERDEFIRTFYGIQFGHLSVIGALLYLSRLRSPFSVAVSYTALVIGMLNIIFSATRGWIIASIFLLLAYSFFMLPKLFRNLFIIIPISLIFIFVVMQVPVMKNQITKTYERVLYYENLLNPDLNYETTEIGRIKRGHRVMTKFRESPWVGIGLGRQYRLYRDSHTGNQTLLLSFGIIGYLLFLNLWLSFVFKLLSQDSIFRPRNPEFKLHVLMAVSFISVFIVHSTSGGFLHPEVGSISVFWYGLIFAYGNLLYYQQRRGLIQQ